MKFECPECSSDLLEEIYKGATIYNKIEEINKDELEYSGDPDILDGYVECYACNYCGFVLEYDDGSFVVGHDKVFSFLKMNGWLK